MPSLVERRIPPAYRAVVDAWTRSKFMLPSAQQYRDCYLARKNSSCQSKSSGTRETDWFGAWCGVSTIEYCLPLMHAYSGTYLRTILKFDYRFKHAMILSRCRNSSRWTTADCGRNEVEAQSLITSRDVVTSSWRLITLQESTTGNFTKFVSILPAHNAQWTLIGWFFSYWVLTVWKNEPKPLSCFIEHFTRRMKRLQWGGGDSAVQLKFLWAFVKYVLFLSWYRYYIKGVWRLTRPQLMYNIPGDYLLRAFLTPGVVPCVEFKYVIHNILNWRLYLQFDIFYGVFLVS